jgi:hypothetical protein
MSTVTRFHKLRAPLICGLSALALVTVAGCGPIRLIANTNIPTPLVVKMPIAVALFIPKEFSTYVHNEERWSTDWHVDLGKAQSDGITRLMSALFERVVQVESVSAGQTHADSGVRAILEPSIEEFAFVTPRDAGSPFFAVSIKYRVNIYLPDGKLADSWGFTGYGTAPAEGLSSAPPLQTATALAMRDAGAKLAVEFREQATVRGLLPEGPTADTLVKPVPEPSAPANTQQPAPAAPATPGGQTEEEDSSEESDDSPPQDEPAVARAVIHRNGCPTELGADAGRERLRHRFLRRESRCEMLPRIFHREAVSALLLGEHPLEKSLALSLEHALHALNLDHVATDPEQNATWWKLDVHFLG